MGIPAFFFMVFILYANKLTSPVQTNT